MCTAWLTLQVLYYVKQIEKIRLHEVSNQEFYQGQNILLGSLMCD